MPVQIVHTYVDHALAQLRRLGLRRFPGDLPDMMIDSSIPPSNDWIGWRAIPSTVTEEDLDELEAKLNLTLPPSYRAFLQYKHFCELTEWGLRFNRHIIGSWKKNLLSIYQGYDEIIREF